MQNPIVDASLTKASLGQWPKQHGWVQVGLGDHDGTEEKAPKDGRLPLFRRTKTYLPDRGSIDMGWSDAKKRVQKWYLLELCSRHTFRQLEFFLFFFDCSL